jgi:hypothetical protein
MPHKFADILVFFFNSLNETARQELKAEAGIQRLQTQHNKICCCDYLETVILYCDEHGWNGSW